MAVFTINGQPYDDLGSAIEALRTIWAEHKAPAVREQHRVALSRPTRLDEQRAAYGVTEADVRLPR